MPGRRILYPIRYRYICQFALDARILDLIKCNRCYRDFNLAIGLNKLL